ncbi:MAG: rod shape-determining protein MreC [Bacteroidia bacterium]|nr:rod shape-determining protein MreC [Bacteroidia bacterium]
MQNFGDFLRKYSRLILLVFLLGVSFVLIYLNNNYQRVVMFGAANRVAGSVNEKYSEIDAYFDLREQNDMLARENAGLRSRLLQDQYRVFSGKQTVKDTQYKQVYFYIPARVINNSIDKANNYITIDVGTRQGVRSGMGLISPSGAVGVVKTVSEDYAVCMSLLHRKMALKARIKGTREFGSLSWQSTRPDELMLGFIASHIKIKEGDTVETTSFSSIFPEGIPIGTIKGYETDADEGYLNLKIKPLQSFTSLSQVYVVDYTGRAEQDSLETMARQGDKDDE